MTGSKATSSTCSHPGAGRPLSTSTHIDDARRGLEVMGLLTLADRRSALDARELDRVSLLASTVHRPSRGLDELSLSALGPDVHPLDDGIGPESNAC